MVGATLLGLAALAGCGGSSNTSATDAEPAAKKNSAN